MEEKKAKGHEKEVENNPAIEEKFLAKLTSLLDIAK